MSKESLPISEGEMTGTAGLLELRCFLTPTGKLSGATSLATAVSGVLQMHAEELGFESSSGFFKVQC